MMNEDDFKKTYIATFLAAYAAKQYDFNCQTGWEKDFPPIEDSQTLAQDAWNKLQERS